jgi:hypothetical protein
MKYSIFILTLFLFSCLSNKGSWSGRKITSPGTYEVGPGISLEVFTEGSWVKYTVTNKKGDVIMKSSDGMSAHQKWAFYLDENKDLWVFSTDIGDSVWRRQPSGFYHHQYFNSFLSPDQVPPSVYQYCKEFFYKI